MEERLLNEKESLELITQMINSSKKNMEVGQGNIMLFWGYFTDSLIGCAVSADQLHTQLHLELGLDADVRRMAGDLLQKTTKQTEGRYLYRQSDLTGMASDEIHVYHYFSDDRHYGDYIRQTCRFPAYATALPGLLRTRHFHYRHYNTGALDDLRPPHCVYCSNIYANHATDR